jgi:hypothetical protein
LFVHTCSRSLQVFIYWENRNSAARFFST